MNEKLEHTTNETSEAETRGVKQQFTTVTTFSKYLALALFIALPFLGGWIGYTYAPEKVVEVEKITVFKESNKEDLNIGIDSNNDESIDTSDWVTFSNSDGVYQIKYPPSWEVETEMYYNFQRFKLINVGPDGSKMIFDVGFIANPRYTDEFGDVGGRVATYGEYDSCINEGQTRAGGPECILTIVNVPLTAQETAEVRTDTSTDDEWLIEVTLGVSTEEFFVSRDEEVYSNLTDFYQEQEPLLKEVLNSLEFINKKTAQ